MILDMYLIFLFLFIKLVLNIFSLVMQDYQARFVTKAHAFSGVAVYNHFCLKLQF